VRLLASLVETGQVWSLATLRADLYEHFLAEPGLVAAGDFAHEILGQLQVALGTRQPDMAEIRREEWQLRIEVYILFAPQQKAKGRE